MSRDSMASISRTTCLWLQLCPVIIQVTPTHRNVFNTHIHGSARSYGTPLRTWILSFNYSYVSMNKSVAIQTSSQPTLV